ncbi:MAG: caspase family protein [Acidobacteriota bacterium]
MRLFDRSSLFVHRLAGGLAAGLTASGLTAAGLALIAAASTPVPARAEDTSTARADDLVIVDCLLPPKTRRLGRRSTYLQPRQPLRTTAADCRIRGGEYTEPDQATYATSLRVWLPQAEAGDAEAQFYVGQIYEKGLGAAPDLAQAALWYRKAAEQGDAPSAVALGYLFEEGLGVERDEVAALNWYRKAAGLAEDLVVLERSEYDALVAELAAKEQEAQDLENEIEVLRDELEKAAAQQAADDAAEARRVDALRSTVERLEADLAARQREIADGRDEVAQLEKRLRTISSKEPATASATAQSASLNELPFGGYHALVIGNSSYRALPAIESAARDARLVADLLRSKYGFEVRLLIDADRLAIMAALNDLREQLTSEDNLLVYYAGHGERDAAGRAAYWQPVDADADSTVRWIPNEVVTEHLDLIPARHVFVVADSVYSGLRTRSSIAALPRGMTNEERYFHIKLLLDKRARLVLSSGGPGTDGTAPKQARPSRFADTFVELLEQNDGILEASRLYVEINERLADRGAGLEFATMKWARNDLAEFFFVPSTLR